jgi:hypothetical protein
MSATFDQSNAYDALQIPPAAMQQGGMEILRSGIVGGGHHVMFRPVFEDTRMWGRVLADIARQLAQAYEHQGRGSAVEVMENIRFGFEHDMNQPPDVHSEIAPQT